jgi:hypothetical protein
MRKASFWVKLLALAVTIGFFSAGAAVAAELYGRIRGTVLDATGATVPDAAVTASNTGTGFSQTIKTATDGSFEFLNLQVGTYTVSVVKTNFKTYTATGLALSATQIYVLDVKLELGQVSEKVVVEAAPIQVEKTSMQLGYTVSGDKIRDMPLNGRNWVSLQQIQPGVVASSDRFGNNFATNGSQTQQNSYLINGTDANDIPLNTPVVFPSPDAIGEFQLVTNTINPEYGRNSGAILNAVIKSGTNSFHGSGFDFFRDTSLNTRNFFAAKPSVFHQNQFGGTVGGPVWKDHTFGFFSYQGTRAATPQGSGIITTNVFTPAQRGGAFGAGAFTNTKVSVIPLIGDSASPCPVVACAAGTLYSSLFSTGAIPAADLNTQAVSLMNTYVPTACVVNSSGACVFTGTASTTVTTDQYLYRADHTFNSRDAIWFYQFIQRSPSVSTLPFSGATLPGFASSSVSKVKQYTAAWNHTFSGSTLNELRFGYTRLNFKSTNPVNPIQPAAGGFTGIIPQSNVGSLTVVSVRGLFTLGFTTNGPQPRIDDTYQITDNFSKVYGKHSLKFGFEGRQFRYDASIFGARLDGSFAFNRTGRFSTGNSGADFLLGVPDTYNQSSGNGIVAVAKQYYFYAQDQWKVRSNLTLTYGMGYQIDTPLTDTLNNSRAINCFIPFQTSTVFPTAPAGMNFPGDPGCSSSGYRTHFDDWGPRVGFAYSPDWGRISGGPGKFSIRGGFGMYFNRTETELTLQNLNAPPFSQTSNGIADVKGVPAFIAPFTDARCISQTGSAIACSPLSSTGGPTPASIPNKFPFIRPAAGSAVNFTIFEPMFLNVSDPNTRVPYAMNYNLTLQRELSGRMILSVGYVGALGRKLESTQELNPGRNAAGCALIPACFNDPFSQNTNFPGNFAFPGNIFAGIGQQNTAGTSNYNSLQMTVNKAMSHGLSFLASYTYAHSLDTGSGFENAGFGGFGCNCSYRGINPFNTRLFNYGDSAFDARHRLVFSYTYEIPSMRKLHGLSGIPSRVVDGWRIAGIASFQTGFPLDIVDSNGLNLSDGSTFYGLWGVPNVVAPVTKFDPRASSTHTYFSTASFAAEALGTVGNTGRSVIHGPGINNFDFQLSKDTQITEKTKIELRVEIFNMWNHAQFTLPVTDFADSRFGTVRSARDPRLVQLAAKFYF